MSFKQLEDLDRINGSSFHDDVIFATPNELKHILGEPQWEHNDGEDKVNMEWYMEMEDGNVFTVYDYKEYKPLHPNQQVEWHIGGHDSTAVFAIRKLFESAGIRAPVRTGW
mgnify:CR=1 FL=1